MDPDDLYTLRAQFWLGHYTLCLDEGKTIARRPMSPPLKVEREEFVLRSLLALGQHDRVLKETSGNDKPPSIEALALRARFEIDASARDSVLTKFQTMLSDPSYASSSSLQLTAAHVFLAAGKVKEALQCVHLGATMEHLAVSVQIYIKIDRLDLAKEQHELMKQADEDAVLTQLGSVYLNIANGRSTAPDAIHTVHALTEQYGPSTMLLNCMAVAQMTAENYEAAEASLSEAEECLDTLVNKIVCYQHTNKGMDAMQPILNKLKAQYPSHPFVEGLVRVEGAFEREALKYKVKASG